MNRKALPGCLALVATLSGPVDRPVASGPFIVVQSTTSIEHSGLFDRILPDFREKTGIEVRVIAVGTGQAIKNAANGDGDVLFVHDRSAEEAFVAAGHGAGRADVMYNDFVLVGPPEDPAAVAGLTEGVAALARIAARQARFVSRGDDSGTHRAELRFWHQAGIDVAAVSGTWYREAGAGMGATLNTAVGLGAYTLVDRATWLRFGNKRDHRILVEGDPQFFNQYGVVLVSPEKHPHVKAGPGVQFIRWLQSGEGQAAIAAFRIDGQQAFFPNASGIP